MVLKKLKKKMQKNIKKAERAKTNCAKKFKKMPNVKRGSFIVLELLSGHVKRFSVFCMRDVYSKKI